MFGRTPNVSPIEGAVNVAVDGLQVYEICSRRLQYSEVNEARSNYKNP